MPTSIEKLEIYSIHGLRVSVTGKTEKELQDDLLLAFRFAQRLDFDQRKMAKEHKSFVQMNTIAKSINEKCGWPIIFVPPKTAEEIRLWNKEVKKL